MTYMMTGAGTDISPITNLTVPVSDLRDHTRGPKKAPVTLLEYGDYECPYCGQAYSLVKGIQEYFGDSLRFAFRNFPLTQIHPHAQQAAEAAETAGAQGKFWEMHDILYENQEALDYPSLREYAQYLELDMERFDDELTNHVYAERVREDFLSGVMSGVNGTPTFYLNGHRFDGSWNDDELVKAIEELIRLNRNNKASRRM